MKPNDYKKQETQTFIESVESLIRQGAAKNNADIVAKLDWDAGALSNVLNGRRNVPAGMLQKLQEVFNLSNIEKKPAAINGVDFNDPNLLRVIVTIAESNKTLSESNKVLVESNKVLVDSNKELASLAHEAFRVNLEKLQKSVPPLMDLETELPEGPKEKIPLNSRLSAKDKTEKAGK